MTDSQTLAAQLILAALGGGGFIGIYFSFRQLSVGRRHHLYQLYRDVLDRMDLPEMRTARSYVYELQRDAFNTEGWLVVTPPSTASLATPAELEEFEKRIGGALPGKLKELFVGASAVSSAAAEHRAKAERVARSFDQLGLLVREGKLPEDLLARFYAFPVLKCWHNLAPFIRELRKTEGGGRSQPGHFWEFENLAMNVVLRGCESKWFRGPWRGVKQHDDLAGLCNTLRAEGSASYIPDHADRDSWRQYRPLGRRWRVARDWQLWRW